jgi:hypothetical protein
MTICSLCVTPLSYPGASPDDAGVCFFCREYAELYGDWDAVKGERQRTFEELVAKARKGAGQYDALVPLSGGKDSTYVLYLATKVYGLRVLAYTFDNGFQTDIAKENIRNAIHASGAAHLVYEIDRDRLMRLYRHFFEHTGLFCPVCMRGINAGRAAMHLKYGTPLLLRGTSLRTEERVTPEIFQSGSLGFFQNVLRRYPVDIPLHDMSLDRSLSEKVGLALGLLSRGRITCGVMEVQVPDYLDWHYNDVYKTIYREFGWRRLPDRDEHVDCVVEPVVHYLRRQRVPALTPNSLRYSALVRAGMMNREVALTLVNEERVRESAIPPETDHLVRCLNISMEQFEAWSQPSFRHMEFQRPTREEQVFATVARWIGKGKIATARR